MKSRALLLGLAVLLTGCGTAAPPKAQATSAAPPAISVRPAASLPAPLSGLAAARVGSTIWIVGGLDTSDVSTTTLLAYEPKRGAVRSDRLPFPTHDASVVAQGGQLLLVGGGRFTSLDTFARITLPAGSFTSLGTTPTPLSDLWSGTLGGVPTIVGGFTGQKASRHIWQYRGGSWQSLALMPYGVRYPAVAEAQGALDIAGGLTTGAPGGNGPNAGILSVTPNGTVTSLGALPVALYRAGAAWEGGALYIFGGQTTSGYLNTIYRFNPKTEKTTLVGHLPKAWSYGAVVKEGSQVYLIGGQNAEGTLASVWRVSFTPQK